MSPLDIKRTKAELLSVQAAKANIEVSIEEKLEEISRLQAHVKISEARELELTNKLSKKDE